ncbi:MAG: hypothetical protein J7J93_02465 [Candidatus Aenigmarchaeota archaeon]|nr:hypothetical protein [Candidatus Aenigmarchaeota archaeon]
MKVIKFMFIFGFIFIIFSANLVRAGFFDWFLGMFGSSCSNLCEGTSITIDKCPSTPDENGKIEISGSVNWDGKDDDGNNCNGGTIYYYIDDKLYNGEDNPKAINKNFNYEFDVSRYIGKHTIKIQVTSSSCIVAEKECEFEVKSKCKFIDDECTIKDLENNQVKIKAKVKDCDGFYVSTYGSSGTSYKYKHPVYINSNNEQYIYAIYECNEDTDATFKFELRKSGVYPSPSIECSGECPHEEPSECSLSITFSDGIGGGSDGNITYKGKIKNCKGKKYKTYIGNDDILECENSISVINSDDESFKTECECKEDGITYLKLQIYSPSDSKTYTETKVRAHCHNTKEENECTKNGYECCDECKSGTEKPTYDDACSGNKVCCEECKKSIIDEPCDDKGTWIKTGIYCGEDIDSDGKINETEREGFCIDDNTYQSNKDHIEIVKEGTNTHCVKCKDDECCHNIRSLCFDHSMSTSTGCTWSPGTVSSVCSNAGGNKCDEKANLASCTLKESQGKLGPVYCADCGGTPTTSPTTTPPTTAPPTTPPTTPTTTLPQHELTCNTPITVGENVTCTLTECTKGLWILTNKEGNPLQYPIVTEIPPSENAELGTTQEEGKILVRGLCTDYDIPTMDSFDVEVKKGVTLTCPDECKANEECECTVEECNLGIFKVENEENEPLENDISEAIGESPFEYKFTTKEAGKVKVIANCVDPKVTKEQVVNITGEAKEEFNMKSVECNKEKCTIDVDKNTMKDDVTVIINLFDEPSGIIYYKAKENIDSGKTGNIDIDLDETRICPTGKNLKVVVLAYRKSNLNKLLDRLKEDAFEC